jgi:hypothetical protein
MPASIPQTLDEAKTVGRAFSGSDKDLQKHGFPTETRQCSPGGAGALCASYICVDGWRLVRYCDTGLGCTEIYEVPC